MGVVCFIVASRDVEYKYLCCTRSMTAKLTFRRFGHGGNEKLDGKPLWTFLLDQIVNKSPWPSNNAVR